MAQKTIESLEKELAEAKVVIDTQNKQLDEAELVIADLKEKLAVAESKEATVGYPVVKSKDKKDVEVLNAEFFLPKRGEITLDILKKDPELVSKLLDMNSENVRLKQ